MQGKTVLTQRKLHRSGCECVGLSRCFHAQRLVWALVVVKANPVTNDPAGVLQALKAGINARSPIFCIRRCTHLWLTGLAIELHRAAVIRLYP